MTDLDTNEPLSNTSSSSFVVLGKGSLSPSISNETSDVEFMDKHQATFFNLKSNKPPSNMDTSRTLFEGQGFLEDDIQEKLKNLVRENHKLKETLSQNNLAIKSQLDTFYMWQKEVLKTHETHKQKFLETKDLILKLQDENLNLKKQLEEGFFIINNDDSLGQINIKCGSDNLKQETDKVQSMCEDLTNKNVTLEMENMNLKEKLKATENEVLKLNNEVEDVMRENKFLKQKNDELQKNVVGSLTHGSLPNSEARAQISNLFKQLEIERNKVSKLKEKLEKANNILSKTQSLSVVEEVDEFIKNLNDINLSFDSQNQRYRSLQSWVTLAEENIKEDNFGGADKNLLGEINKLKCYISHEEKTSKEKQEIIQELKDHFHRLLSDYKALQQQLDFVKCKEAEAEKFKNECNTLSQQLKNKEAQLLLKQQECEKLKEDIKKLNLECEELAILKVQVELYQTDFNDERKAREELAGEKERMAEQLRYLQSRLEACSNNNNNKGHTEEQTKKQETEEPKSVFVGANNGRNDRYLCPMCMHSFSDVTNFQEHVYECSISQFMN